MQGEWRATHEAASSACWLYRNPRSIGSGLLRIAVFVEHKSHTSVAE